jgi:hypothetical protein
MRQKLITKAVEAKLRNTPLYSTDGTPVEDKQVLVKFFTPWANWTWYVFEAERVDGTDDWRFFGLVQGLATELGYFQLSELQRLQGPAGLRVERDMYAPPTRVRVEDGKVLESR